MDNMLNVDFYHKSNGECPVQEYLESLSPKLRTKTLRSVVGNDITRVLYFFIEGNTAILTNGFTKKTQKTPVREIEKANLYRADYFVQNRRKE